MMLRRVLQFAVAVAASILTGQFHYVIVITGKTGSQTSSLDGLTLMKVETVSL
jgi:hypothetical protein